MSEDANPRGIGAGGPDFAGRWPRDNDWIRRPRMFVGRGPAMSLLRRSHRPSQMDRTGRRGGVALLAGYISHPALLTLTDGAARRRFVAPTETCALVRRRSGVQFPPAALLSGSGRSATAEAPFL